MATNTSSGSIKTSKRRHMSSSSDEEVSSFVKDYWPRFLVIECADGSPLNINPFAKVSAETLKMSHVSGVVCS